MLISKALYQKSEYSKSTYFKNTNFGKIFSLLEKSGSNGTGTLKSGSQGPYHHCLFKQLSSAAHRTFTLYLNLKVLSSSLLSIITNQFPSNCICLPAKGDNDHLLTAACPLHHESTNIKSSIFFNVLTSKCLHQQFSQNKSIIQYCATANTCRASRRPVLFR